MDGLCHVVGAPVEIEIVGKLYWLEPLTLRCLAAIENHILAGRDNPAQQLANQIDKLQEYPEFQQMIRDKLETDLMADKSLARVSIDILDTWLQHPAGAAYTAWLCLRRGDGQRMTWERIIKLFADAGESVVKEYVRRLYLVSGMDLLSKIDWPRKNTDDDWRRPKYIPWRAIFFGYAQAFQWTPQQVGELTMFQVRLYNSDEKSLGSGVQSVSMNPAKAYRDKKAALERATHSEVK